MDPIVNPFSPGAGSPPPELAGREEMIDNARIALARVIQGRSAQSQILLGLRGTGKTVLLNEIEVLANENNYITSFIEAPEGRSLAELLYPQMRQVLRQLSKLEKARVAANRAMSGLRNFASVFKISLGEIEIGIEPTTGIADSGELELDLKEMFQLIGEAAKTVSKGWALIIDEVQYLKEQEFAAVIVSVHKIAQQNLPVFVVAGGLPQIAKLSGEAKSYSERLFTFPEVGPLNEEDSTIALKAPVERADAKISDSALLEIIKKTKGYPFFLQEWGYQAWNVAKGDEIHSEDITSATEKALTRLDKSFFRVRMDRLTDAEKEYVQAMADIGDGPYKTSSVARKMKRKSSSLGPVRASVIEKGMIYSPKYGFLDFTVPLFADFLRRTQ